MFNVSRFIRSWILQAMLRTGVFHALPEQPTQPLAQPTDGSATGQFQVVHAACFLLLNPTLCVIVINVFISHNIKGAVSPANSGKLSALSRNIWLHIWRERAEQVMFCQYLAGFHSGSVISATAKHHNYCLISRAVFAVIAWCRWDDEASSSF